MQGGVAELVHRSGLAEHLSVQGGLKQRHKPHPLTT